MFRKSVEVKSHQRLSGADKKKLKRTLRDKFPRPSDSDFDLLLPPKAEVTAAKLQNRVTVYSLEDGLPMFFDIDGRGSEFYPSVFALWKVPELLPSFTLKGGGVSKYIIGGADLMFPGVEVPPEGLPNFSAGEAWSVKVPNNQCPIAVGSTTLSSTEATNAGLRGKALRITHHYSDMLWESVEEHLTPNEGFLDDVVVENPSEISNSDDNPAPNQTEDDQIEELSASVSGIELESTETEPALSSTEEVDLCLDNCLLQALHTSVKDKDLPILGSILWSNHILPCRPAGINLDIKRSSHKKLSKWLQAKSSHGLISVKEDKYKKESVLISVNRTHPDFLSFNPEKKPNPVPVPDQRTEPTTLEVKEMYKATAHVNPILDAVGFDTRNVCTASDASDLVFQYVQKENLSSPSDPSIVILNPILCDALYKGAIKKGTAYPTTIHKRDLGTAFVTRMQPHHIVTRGSDSVIRKGAIKPIQIVTERRQGNKKVTKVSGVEAFFIDADSLACELQKKFACSTSLGELPGKKGFEVLIQGGVIDDVARHLVEQYSVPKKYIEILDKTKK